MIVPPCPSYITFYGTDALFNFLRSLLTLRHLRLAFIKFLQLLIPHVLWRDANPTAEDSF